MFIGLDRELNLIERVALPDHVRLIMRSLHYTLMACAAAAALVGCATTDNDRSNARGAASNEPITYENDNDTADPVITGPNRGVNTNYFGPVNSGPEAARGPGTPSGHYDQLRP